MVVLESPTNRRPRMAESIAGAVSRIKDDVAAALDPRAVERLCRELGHQWRERELDPATTVALFVQQVLHGNCPCSEVRHLAGGGGSFTASAYCQARARVPLAVYQSLLTEVCDAALPATRQKDHLWLGRNRTFLIDGSTFSMPDTPGLRKAFGVPARQKAGCIFPVAHLLVLFSAATGLLLDAAASPLYTGDVAGAPDLHPHLGEGGVLIGDDSFGTYAHLALLLQAGLHGLFPVHHKRLVDFAPGRLRPRPRPHARRQGGGRRDAAVPVARVAGARRPGRGVVQAEAAAGVDEPRALRRAARFDHGAGTAADGAPPGPGRGDADDGDDAARPAPLCGRGAAGPAAAPLG